MMDLPTKIGLGCMGACAVFVTFLYLAEVAESVFRNWEKRRDRQP